MAHGLWNLHSYKAWEQGSQVVYVADASATTSVKMPRWSRLVNLSKLNVQIRQPIMGYTHRNNLFKKHDEGPSTHIKFEMSCTRTMFKYHAHIAWGSSINTNAPPHAQSWRAKATLQPCAWCGLRAQYVQRPFGIGCAAVLCWTS